MRPAACCQPSARAAAGLSLRPLEEMMSIAAAARRWASLQDDPQLVRAASLAEGSVARAIALMDGPLLTLREKIGDLLARLPETDPLALHALGDSLGRADDAAMTTFNDAVRKWLGEQVERSGRARTARAYCRCVGQIQSARRRRRNLQYRTQTAGIRGVRVACRGGAR